MSSVRTAHLESLAQKTGMTYVELQKVGGISNALLSSGSARALPISSNIAFVPAIVALGLTILLYALSLFGGGSRFNGTGRQQPAA